MPTENRRDELHRLLAIYRQHLTDGATGDLATLYLNFIDKSEAELEGLGKDTGAGKHKGSPV